MSRGEASVTRGSRLLSLDRQTKGPVVRRQLSVKHRDQNSAPKKQNTDPKKKSEEKPGLLQENANAAAGGVRGGRWSRMVLCQSLVKNYRQNNLQSDTTLNHC